MLTDRISKDFLLTYYRDALNMNPVQLYPFMVVSPKTEITQMTIRLFLKNNNLNNSLDLSFKHLFDDKCRCTIVFGSYIKHSSSRMPNVDCRCLLTTSQTQLTIIYSS